MTPVRINGGVDQGQIWHFGHPAKEQSAIETGTGLVWLESLEVVSITGVDRLTFLHSLTSQNFTGLKVGQGVSALVLSPTGKIEYQLHGVDDGETFWAWTGKSEGQKLVDFFESMKFMLDVKASVEEDLEVLWVGETIDFEQLVHSIPSQEAAAKSAAGSVSRSSEVGLGREYFVPKTLPDKLLRLAEKTSGSNSENQVHWCGLWGFEAARIQAGIPRIGVDSDYKTIPNEIGLYATHLDKGCYRGQETVARVHNLGRPPRRLVKLLLDGTMESLPKLGENIFLADNLRGKPVGVMGSAARHNELGPIGLALIKRNTPVDATLIVDGIAASQEALVDPDVGLHVKVDLTGN